MNARARNLIPFKRVGLHAKFAVLFVVIVIVLLVISVAWSVTTQREQAEQQMLETAQVLALEVDAVWEFMENNQNQFVKNDDGTYKLYCVVVAKSISRMFTLASDYTVHYTNTTTRKIDDAPDAYEQEALAALNADRDRQSYYGLSEDESGEPVFRYVEPLYMAESCLECHGEPAGELDAMGYPKEGKQVGDMAGAVSIIMPADSYLEGVSKNVTREVLIFALVIIAGLSMMFWAITHLITRPLRRMEVAAQQMERREFEHIDLEGIGDRDEIADLAGHLRSSALQLHHLYTDLEGEVDARTRQLESVNRLLEDANKQLMADNRYKTDFLSTMSHELRTPLTAILAFSDIWDDEYAPRDEGERKVTHEIRVNAQQLLELVNNLLDMARLEAGKTAMSVESVELMDLVHEVHNATGVLADQKGVIFTVHVDRDVPIIRADESKIRRILENLVSNAIKFTDAGGSVDVAVSYDAQAGEVVFAVRDTGIGIAPEDQERIFDSFTQARQAGAAPSNGSGLGLAVVRELVELHHGSVSVESEPGCGSVFMVRIPKGNGGRALPDEGEAPDQEKGGEHDVQSDAGR